MKGEREPLTSVDTAWYRFERADSPVDICVLLTFEEPPEPARLKATLRERLLKYDRFRQRVVEAPLGVGHPHWEVDPGFELADHLHETTLPAPGDDAALQDAIGAIMSRPLDLERPLWEVHLLQGYGEGAAMVARLHHCIGDGFALVRVFLTLTDPRPDAAIEGEEVELDADEEAPTAHLMEEVLDALRHPSRLADAAKKTARAGASLAHLLALPFDPDTPLRGELSGVRRVSWTRRFSVSELKERAHAHGGTLNDLLLAALTGALRRYLIEAGAEVDGLTIRAIVPVNLRPVRSVEEMAPALGNRFGLVFLPLPIHTGDADEQMSALRAEMERLKESPEAVVAFGILDAIGHAPATIEHLVDDLFGPKGTVVATNVPGPKGTLYLAGARITDAMFWVPHPARLAVGISILSYDGCVRVGVRTDVAVVPDPQVIVRAFEEALEALG